MGVRVPPRAPTLFQGVAAGRKTALCSLDCFSAIFRPLFHGTFKASRDPQCPQSDHQKISVILPMPPARCMPRRSVDGRWGAWSARDLEAIVEKMGQQVASFGGWNSGACAMERSGITQSTKASVPIYCRGVGNEFMSLTSVARAKPAHLADFRRTRSERSQSSLQSVDQWSTNWPLPRQPKRGRHVRTRALRRGEAQ